MQPSQKLANSLPYGAAKSPPYPLWLLASPKPPLWLRIKQSPKPALTLPPQYGALVMNTNGSLERFTKEIVIGNWWGTWKERAPLPGLSFYQAVEISLTRSSVVKVTGTRDEAIALTQNRIRNWWKRQKLKARATS
jgi:hypothetical protein